ncbi:MAG: hypothetical protein E7241_08295 [Lachnospiraceae bacterium]|nr:hypothetical protein [Lachnospiraceae bacterium]
MAFVALFIKSGNIQDVIKTLTGQAPEASFDASNIPEYSGELYVKINNGKPEFDTADADKGAFETYSELDSLGRCGVAYANLCKELMPKGQREDISMIKPTGWKRTKYPGVVEDDLLYNRCHLIAYSLAGENANEKNLITGTRYFNKEGMLPFEEMVRDYIYKTGNHVLYRVTPVFEGKNPVAKGVIMEAYSVEDKGKGISYNIFVYNIQPGVEIDYSTGNSKLKQAASNVGYGLSF